MEIITDGDTFDVHVELKITLQLFNWFVIRWLIKTCVCNILHVQFACYRRIANQKDFFIEIHWLQICGQKPGRTNNVVFDYIFNADLHQSLQIHFPRFRAIIRYKETAFFIFIFEFIQAIDAPLKWKITTRFFIFIFHDTYSSLDDIAWCDSISFSYQHLFDVFDISVAYCWNKLPFFSMNSKRLKYIEIDWTSPGTLSIPKSQV